MHCVCCPIALVSLERNSGERKRDAERKREKKCVSCARKGGEGCRLEGTNAAWKLYRERRKKQERERERGSGMQVHRGPIIRAGRPITYWFFTYDLIHYHSVIYICPTCCGFWGFALRTRETQGKMQPRRTRTYPWTVCIVSLPKTYHNRS